MIIVFVMIIRIIVILIQCNNNTLIIIIMIIIIKAKDIHVDIQSAWNRSYLWHYKNTPIHIYRNFTSQNWKISDKKLWCFSYIWPKHIGEAVLTSTHNLCFWGEIKQNKVRGMFEMNCLLSSSSISTWGTIKTNTYLYKAIQYLHNGV